MNCILRLALSPHLLAVRAILSHVCLFFLLLSTQIIGPDLVGAFGRLYASRFVDLSTRRPTRLSLSTFK